MPKINFKSGRNDQESFLRSEPRVPEPYENIQVNHCKNPTCPNYGVRASSEVQPRGRYADASKQDGYIRQNNKGLPHLRCKYCGVRFPIKSNQGIYEEKQRCGKYPEPEPEPSCRNEQCTNYGKGLKTHPSLYRSFGKTEVGSKRYRCIGRDSNGEVCNRTFSVPQSTIHRQRMSHINRLVFKCLVNRNSVSGMADIFGVSRDTIEGKIDFVYEQCCKFVETQEAKLLKGVDLKKLYISVDRQFYTVNWELYEDRRNSILYGLAAADNASNFVFGMDANYDPWIDYDELEKEVGKTNDYQLSFPFRRYARFWLKKEFEELHAEAVAKAKAEGQKKSRRKKAEFYPSEEERRYAETAMRADIDNPDKIFAHIRLPEHGILVRGDYHLYGFFQRIKELVSGAEKLRFFMDQESGIRAACLSAFVPEIRGRKCDAFYVQIARGLRRPIKDKEAENAEAKLEDLCREKKISPKKARLLLLREALHEIKEKGQYGDRWYTHPLPTRSEPRKKVCYLTDYGDYDEKHLAWLYNKASLHGVNNYFNNIRMKLIALSRGIVSATSPDKVWTPYSPYDPTRVHKLLLIHRVHYNYVRRRGLPEGKTPAMRLEILDRPIEPEEILHGKGMALSRRKSLVAFTEAKKKSFLIGPEPEDRGDCKPKKFSLRTSLKSGKAEFVYLDTETTGTTYRHRIVEIAIIDDKGTVLIDTLVQPEDQIPKKATALHGITNQMVANAPKFAEIEDQIIAAVTGKYVVIYNAGFDTMFLSKPVKAAMMGAVCCMERYSEYNAETGWDGSLLGSSLINAAAAIGHKFEGQAHRALPDTRACRAVWRFLMKHPVRKRRIPPAFTGI